MTECDCTKNCKIELSFIIVLTLPTGFTLKIKYEIFVSIKNINKVGFIQTLYAQECCRIFGLTMELLRMLLRCLFLLITQFKSL